MSKLDLYVIGTIVALLVTAVQIGQKRRRTDNISDEIIKNYYKILVDAKMFSVLSREYFAEVDNGYPTRIEAWDALYDNERNYRQEKRVVSVLICRDYSFKGALVQLKSEPLHMSESFIKSKLQHQKKITIYLKPGDVATQYFDLSFLS